MRQHKTRATWGLLFPLLGPCLLIAQASIPQRVQESCREFVQEFYDWYVPKTQFAELQKHPGPVLDRALKERRSEFSRELAHKIEVCKAQAEREREVFLDFDPILNSQDPGERYVAGNVSPKAGTYKVEIFGVFAGKRSTRPDVVAEVALKKGKWVFVNFHYPGAGPGSENLLGILSYHRDNRKEPPK